MTFPTDEHEKPWQRHPLTQLAAMAIGVLPIYVFAIWTHLTRERALGLNELMLYPLAFGGGSVVLMLLLLKFLCGDSISSLNLRTGRWWRDVLVGILLAVALLLLLVILQYTVARWFPSGPAGSAEELQTLMEGLSRNPLLLALWLGPVVWLGVAAFEELSRVFMLSRLWKVWPRPTGRWLALIFSAVLFGLVHIYQGPVGAISNGIIGLIYGWYYMLFGRVWPMIIAHALYDSAQIVQVVNLINRGMI
jgi:membrane protease YdiL (CAAX protease family)